MNPPPIRALLLKELRQIKRSKGVLASSTLLPATVLVIVPMSQLFTARSAESVAQLPTNAPVPPGLAGIIHSPEDLFVQALFPMFVALTGLLVPSVSGSYTIVAEREKRSLELLMALPLRVGDILWAKLLSLLLLALAVVVPMYFLDAAILLLLGVASAGSSRVSSSYSSPHSRARAEWPCSLRSWRATFGPPTI
jgi:ABC-2 type transport system permease protein